MRKKTEMLQRSFKKVAKLCCARGLCKPHHIRKDTEAQREMFQTTPQSSNDNTEPRI